MTEFWREHDSGLKLEEELRRMDRDELEVEVINNRELASIFRRYSNALESLIESYEKKHAVVYKKEIKKLLFPTEAGAFMDPMNVQIIEYLMKRYDEFAGMLGYVYSDEECYQVNPVNV